MKQFLFVLVLLGCCYGNAQTGAGNIRIDAFYNTDNKLRHNIPIHQLHVCVIGPEKDTIGNDTVALQFRLLNLNPGSYRLIAWHANDEPIVLDVEVSSDRITFITLLFEPKKKYRRRFQTGADN
jgi:hypothetical protein